MTVTVKRCARLQIPALFTHCHLRHFCALLARVTMLTGFAIAKHRSVELMAKLRRMTVQWKLAESALPPGRCANALANAPILCAMSRNGF